MTTISLAELEKIYHDLRGNIGALQTICDASFGKANDPNSGAPLYQTALKRIHASLDHLRVMKEAVKAGAAPGARM
ncbi:hypothetical protein WDW86_04980 [Bdellovibrionota bacterium FG-2]